MENYKKVLELVKKGLTISQALAALKLSRATFYRTLSQEQHRLLQEAKTAQAVRGVKGKQKGL